MKRLSIWILAAVLAATLALPARADSDALDAEKLADKAKWTVQSFKSSTQKPLDLFRDLLKTAKGVVIFPNVIKGGFLVGAEGGHGVLVGRDARGNWGYPAFYTMGGASFGLQIGGQASETILVLRTPGAVRSIIKHQGKLGADAEVTVVNVGAGMEAATTTNLGADIVAFSQSAGLFGGGSLEGSVLARRNDWNEAFYGPGATPEAIVLEGKFRNPKADGLRAALVVR